MNFLIIGAGAWGCAMAAHLKRCGHAVTVVCHNDEVKAKLQRDGENKTRLPGIKLAGIEFITPEEIPSETDVAMVALPSHVFKEVIGPLKIKTQSWVGLAKGFIFETLSTPCELLERILPRGAKVLCLNGPAHAAEVAQGLPCAMVLCGSASRKAMQNLQTAISSSTMRIYTSRDRRGAELGGALKNSFAVAAGVCDGLGIGDNAKAGLMTRALSEMARIGMRLGGKRETFFGLTGVGDLMATSYGAWSRNRQLGERVARGESAEILVAQGLTAEGYRASKGLLELARKKHVPSPILEQVVEVLYQGKDSREAMMTLMGRKLKRE
jgi:glycerol-3-phosphate dehydrogenase (NAD(P)+)